LLLIAAPGAGNNPTPQPVGKVFAFASGPFHSSVMTQPLALVLYEQLLPGTQLINRLQDLKYRVQALTDSSALVATARQEKPMIVLADLVSSRGSISQAIAELRANADTKHIPVIAFFSEQAAAGAEAARQAGALVVSDTAILNHLPQFLDQALNVE
jgi:CheY-like chemotaxis protein